MFKPTFFVFVYQVITIGSPGYACIETMVNTGLSTPPRHNSTPTSSIYIRDPSTHNPPFHPSIPSNFTIDNPFKHP